jgi:hypothetical protein
MFRNIGTTLLISVLLGFGFAIGSQYFLQPNKDDLPRSQVCYAESNIPQCPSTITWTSQKGWPFAYRTINYKVEFDSPSPTANISRKILQSNNFSLPGLIWSVIVWSGLVFGFLLLWRRWAKKGIAKDFVLLSLLAISLVFLIIYQVGGGDNSNSTLIRDCINIFQFVLLVTAIYLSIRPRLRKWIMKSTSSQAKIGKTIIGLFFATAISALIVYILALMLSTLV